MFFIFFSYSFSDPKIKKKHKTYNAKKNKERKLTLPNPTFSLFDKRRANAAGNGGGVRCKAPQNPPLSEPFPSDVLCFVLLAAETILCAALEIKK